MVGVGVGALTGERGTETQLRKLARLHFRRW